MVERYTVLVEGATKMVETVIQAEGLPSGGCGGRQPTPTTPTRQPKNAKNPLTGVGSTGQRALGFG
jgi:hypothetical protein